MTRVDVDYDTDRWIRVPLDYTDSPWRDAQEWSQWLAGTATAGRADAATTAPLVLASALEIALFPAAHVWARFWHYPVDGVPTGFVDAYVQRRDPDGTLAADLLPEPGMTALPPVVDDVVGTDYLSAVVRHSLVLVLRSEDDDDPAAMPRIEWLGITDDWVCYLVTNDHDPAAANARAIDADALFRGFATHDLAVDGAET